MSESDNLVVPSEKYRLAIVSCKTEFPISPPESPPSPDGRAMPNPFLEKPELEDGKGEENKNKETETKNVESMERELEYHRLMKKYHDNESSKAEEDVQQLQSFLENVLFAVSKLSDPKKKEKEKEKVSLVNIKSTLLSPLESVVEELASII